MSEIKVDTVAEKTSDNGVTVDGLNIKDSKLVTANSVITSNITDANITTAKIADVNVTEGKIADNAITLAKMASGTDGNIISYDASGNPVAIATGNDGQVLTSTGAGSPPAFETLPGGGSLELLATTTISNLSSISFNSSLITDTYKTYKAIVENLRTTADSVYLYWQLSSDNGSSYLTSGYSRMIYYIDNQGSGGSAGGDENKPGFYLNGSSALGNAGREALNSEITFFGLRSSTTNKSTFHTTIFNKTNAYPQAELGGFHYSSATVMNNLKLLPNSGNLSTGTVKFYGVK